MQSLILHYLYIIFYYDFNNRRNPKNLLKMANKDLFKQAIAEAKSIREAAITNAKEALEETLTPHLKDMLAAKLQEMEDSSVEEVVTESEEVEEEVSEAQGNVDAHDENPHDQLEEAEVEEAMEEEPMEEAEGDDEAEADAEVDSEESEDEAEDEEEIEVKDMEVDDLKDLIRDIISQEMGGDEESLDNTDMDAGAEMGDMEAGAEEEEINLDELLAELENELAEGEHGDKEMEEAHCNTKEEGVEEEISEEVEEEVKEEVKEDVSELNEALTTIKALQNQLQEVNLLNAKLMYVNKVFKSNNLNESQKVNIIAAFDKAETVKEVKLVFETVSDNIVVKKPTAIKESKLGMASKATGTTASKPEVIAEVSSAVQRMQKLAGII